MAELVPAFVTAGFGLVLLLILVLAVLRPLRRFARANAALRSAVSRRMAPLQALLNSRRPGAE